MCIIYVNKLEVERRFNYSKSVIARYVYEAFDNISSIEDLRVIKE